jgi:sulfide:quinone oxidoreductase
VPLYELALLTAAYARRQDRRLQIYLVTPEVRPLKVFGVDAGAAIEREIARAGIELHTGVELRAGGATTVREPGLVSIGRSELHAELIVTLPRISGPNLRGIPAGPSWFIPIDDYCEVEDAGGRVFAAGDATDFPVKHGGLGAGQADTAAAGIAHLAGAGPAPEPFEPVIRGTVLTGEGPLYLSARVVKGLGWRSEVHQQPPWPAEDKVVAEELGAYLAGRRD